MPMRSLGQDGQTFIELLTAIFVLSLALVSALGLAHSNARNQALGSMRLTATHLAREGIELARATRDSNWLAERPPDEWNTGIKADNTRSCAIIPGGGERFALQNCGIDVQGQGTDYTLFQYLFDVFRSNATGEFYQRTGTSNEAGTGTLSGFYRRVLFDVICLDGGGTERIVRDRDANSCGLDTQIGVEITSEVGWRFGRGSFITTISEQLMNWR